MPRSLTPSLPLLPHSLLSLPLRKHARSRISIDLPLATLSPRIQFRAVLRGVAIWTVRLAHCISAIISIIGHAGAFSPAMILVYYS